MPAVARTELPRTSLLQGFRQPGDFLDCYACVSTLPARKAARVLTCFPAWTMALLRVRNAFATPFGLRGAAPAGARTFGPFPVERETADEVLLGFDDRHLDFRVSVMQHEARIHCATWVRPHNIGGRLYLAEVMPFHVLIIRNGLARVGRAD